MGSKEDAKNMALLFFMDHLMRKSDSRTIHDLSCQFGSRGFTPAMREAVGNTQEGLAEFLAQFPSLFKIEGDQISINAYGDFSMGGGVSGSPFFQNLAKERDYVQEAVDFFVQKLQKFGPEMQVKSLLGHRSQTAPEIRLVSGRHVKDFADFLHSHPESFVVEGDRVRLRNMPEPTALNAEVDEDGQPLVGARAKQVAVDFLRSVLEAEESPVPMEALYKQFCSRFSHNVRQDVATNPKELLHFLKLNRTIFFIRSNKVSLVKNKPADAVDSEGQTSEDGTSGGNSRTERSNAGSPATTTRETPAAAVDVQLVRSLKQAQTVVQDIRSRVAGSAPVVSLDCKVVAVGTQEFISIIVMGTLAGRQYLFDVAPSTSIVLESGLKDLFESMQWIKVMHDCKRVSCILKQQFGIQLRNVFDTQVAHAIIQHDRTGKPLHEVKLASFFTVQRLYCPHSIMASDSNPRKLQKRDHKLLFCARPLTDEMIEMAVEESRALVPTIYQTMNSAIKAESQSLLRQLCDEQVNTLIDREVVESQRRERRRNFSLNVINDKLNHDPSGSSLSSKEKRLLHENEHAYGGPGGIVNVLQNKMQNGSERTVQSSDDLCSACRGSKAAVVRPSLPAPKQLAASRVPRMDVGCQTMSTGDIVITKLYYGE